MAAKKSANKVATCTHAQLLCIGVQKGGDEFPDYKQGMCLRCHNGVTILDSSYALQTPAPDGKDNGAIYRLKGAPQADAREMHHQA